MNASLNVNLILALALALGLGLVLAVALSSNNITEALTQLRNRLLPGWSSLNLHGYTNTCLTDKPYGFPSHSNMYNYWRDMPKSWAVEYSEKRVRGDINTVRSNQQPLTLNGSNPAATVASGVDPKYYHNPNGYCKTNPSKYPCPNHWRNGPHVRTHVSGDMSKPVPKMSNQHRVPVSDADINDNYHMRIIQSGREDHGLCGNDFKTTEIY